MTVAMVNVLCVVFKPQEEYKYHGQSSAPFKFFERSMKQVFFSSKSMSFPTA